MIQSGPITSRLESRQARSVFSEIDYPSDGDPSSAFWRSTPAILLTQNAYGEPLAGPATEVRSRWSFKYLYLLFTCPYETLYLKPDPITSSETNRLWEWEVAEAFIRADETNIRRYKEFEVSPQGEWVDVDVDLDAANHEDGWVWSSGMEVASHIDSHRRIWHGSMRIPFSSLCSQVVTVGTILRANFFRSCGPQRTSVAWIPTMKPTFHVPEVFGRLLLDNG